MQSRRLQGKHYGFGTYSRSSTLEISSQERQFFIQTIKEQSDLQLIQAHTGD
jgi:hypothetical protein